MALPRAASIYFNSEIYAFSIVSYRGPGKQSTHLKYMVLSNMGLSFCVWDCGPTLVYFSLSLSLSLSLSIHFVDGLLP